MADKKENNKPLLPTKPPRGNYQIWVILADGGSDFWGYVLQ